MVVQYSSFCCICTTRTGTIIIAVISLMIGTILFLDGGTNIIQSLAVEPSRPDASTAALDEPSTGYFITRGVETIGGFIEAAISTLLLVGVHRNKPDYVLPWIIVSTILCVIRFFTLSFFGLTLLLFSTLTRNRGEPDTSNGGGSRHWDSDVIFILIFAAIFTFAAAHVFAIATVNSFNRTLKSGPSPTVTVELAPLELNPRA